MKHGTKIIFLGLLIMAIGWLTRETQAQSPCETGKSCVYLPSLLKNFDPSTSPTATSSAATATTIAPTVTTSAPTLTPTTQPTPTVNPTPIPSVQPPKVASEFVDFTVSVYKTVGVSDRTPYENILGYFADGLYEMTNGAYKVRNITVYQNGQFSDKANMVWSASDWPRASVSGYDGGGQILMGDVFPFGTPYNALESGNQKGAGYTMAHEWGHYQFGVRDEYQGTTASSKITSPQPGDTTIDTSIMGNGNWNAAQTGQFSYLNLSTVKDYPNSSVTTAQLRTYTASCWDTVARPPSEDPRSGSSSAVLRYDYSTLLSQVAPTGGSAPTVELPGNAAVARSAIKITWADANVVATKYRQLLIDISADMATDNRLESIKTAAKNYVDQARDGDLLGLITYGASFTTLQPVTEINASSRASLKATIDSLTVSVATSRFVTAGDQEAINDLAAAVNKAVVADKAVYLFVSGRFDDSGNPYQTLLDQHSASGIPLTVFDYAPPEANVASILQQVAEFSNGQYKYVGGATSIDITGRRRTKANSTAKPTTLANAMMDADQFGSNLVRVNLGSDSGSVPVGASADPPIIVDSTLDGLEVIAMYNGQANAATLELDDPNGNPVSAPTCTGDAAQTICIFKVITPMVGQWQLFITPVSQTLEVEYRAMGYAEDGFTYQATLQSVYGDYINYPEPILLVAKLTLLDPIIKAAANGYVRGPDGQMIYDDNNPLVLKDDGLAPDVQADDGLYTAFLPYSQEGDYYVSFYFDNVDGDAILTQNSFEHTPGPNGEQNFPPDRLVTDDFDRFATLELFVNHMRTDDHGDTTAQATNLTPNNKDVPGRIDRAGDVDSFKITASAAMTLAIRLSDFSPGMQASIKIIKPDGSTVDKSWTNPASGYFWQSFAANVGEVFFVQVSHANSQAAGGLYNISAGAPLVNEVP